jgi:hypothetical protein
MYLTVHAKALNRAAEILGGTDRLREYLRVPASHLALWLAGSEKPPLDVFLRAVDLISEGPPPEVARSTSALAERARRLRHESGLLRTQVTRTRERSEQIMAGILATRDSVARSRKPRSAVPFLGTRFAPEHGRDMVEAALDACMGATGADKGTLQLRDAGSLVIVAQRGFDKPFLDFFQRVDGDQSACSSALQQAQRVVVADVASHPIFAGTPAEAVLASADVRAVQSTPLLAASGEVLGIVSTHYAVPRQATDRQLRVLDEVAGRTAFWLDGGTA